MNLIDILDLYNLTNDNSSDLMNMLSDYPLDERIDRTALNTSIITKLGACRPITTNSTVFKVLIDEFFTRYSTNISKLLDTLYLEYNPLENNRYERALGEEDTEHRESTGDIDNTDSYTTSNTGSDDISRTEEKKVSAYDSSTYQPKEKIETGSEEDTSSSTTHSGETTSDIKSDVDTEHSHTLKETKSGLEGNVTYQSLIEQERKLSQFNIFNWIIERMHKELFLLVY